MDRLCTYDWIFQCVVHMYHNKYKHEHDASQMPFIKLELLLMHISVEEFLKLPKWKLFMFSSSAAFPHKVNGNNDDVCMLTHNDISEIQHAVLASDNNIYDAFALQTWLKKQDDMFYVIPGMKITQIEYCSIVEYSLKQYMKFGKYLFNSVHKSLRSKFLQIRKSKIRKHTQSHRKKTLNIIKVTHTIQVLKLQNLQMKNKGHLMPPSMSAFTPC